MSGKGIYYYGNGDRLEGSFSNNRPIGECDYYKSGIKYKTQWDNDGVCTNVIE